MMGSFKIFYPKSRKDIVRMCNTIMIFTEQTSCSSLTWCWLKDKS